MYQCLLSKLDVTWILGEKSDFQNELISCVFEFLLQQYYIDFGGGIYYTFLVRPCVYFLYLARQSVPDHSLVNSIKPSYLLRKYVCYSDTHIYILCIMHLLIYFKSFVLFNVLFYDILCLFSKVKGTLIINLICSSFVSKLL